MSELAWAAGFFDGEGYIGFGINTQKKKSGIYSYPRLQMEVDQADVRPLVRFNAVFDCKLGGITLAHRNTGPQHHKSKYRWSSANPDHIIKACFLLYPWLSEPKQEQIQNAFQQYHDYRRAA